MYRLRSLARLLIIPFLLLSCQQIKNITHTLSNFNNLKFKLESVTNFNLAGVNLSTKSTFSDFSASDVLKLGNSFALKKFPASFILNISVKNPNTGKGGTNSIPVKLTMLKWKLYIDGIETVNGIYNRELSVPATNEAIHLPLEIQLDLLQFFENKGYEGLINLALSLGGVKSDPSKILIEAEPTVSSPFGTFQMPLIKITSHTYN